MKCVSISFLHFCPIAKRFPLCFFKFEFFFIKFYLNGGMSHVYETCGIDEFVKKNVAYMKHSIVCDNSSRCNGRSTCYKTWVLKFAFFLLSNIQNSRRAKNKNPLRSIGCVYKVIALFVNKLASFHNYFICFPLYLQIASINVAVVNTTYKFSGKLSMSALLEKLINVDLIL